MDVNNIVIDVLRNLSGTALINNNDSLQEDLGLDSLLMVTLLVDLEEAFGVEFDESDMNPFDLDSVADVMLLVNKYVEGVN